MKAQQSIFLVGPMGVGKTTIGRQLASLMGYEFVDSDREIESRTGASIPWIFDMEGEEGFRRREQNIINELSARPGIVLATGGGAVIKPENRACLKQRGIVVYLRADIDELLARTRNDKNRPLLQTEDPRSRLEALIREREPWYLDVADITFDTQHQNIKAAARMLHGQIVEFEK
ncbi:MAG: shikimate kinase AroK [Gammaproteobacteria bacterium]|jgi:shikimate kinase / 3-dehydroquinate synthase